MTVAAAEKEVVKRYQSANRIGYMRLMLDQKKVVVARRNKALAVRGLFIKRYIKNWKRALLMKRCIDCFEKVAILG